MARKSGSSNTGYSLEKRERASGKPHWRVRVWITDPETGTKKARIVGTFANKTDAHDAGRDAVQQRDRGTLLNASTVTIGELLDTWLATKSTTVTPNTARDYETAIRLHIKPAMGASLLQSLTPPLVQRQYDAWHKSGMSARMVHRCHIVLSQALSYGVRLELTYRNATDNVTKPSTERSHPNVWTAEQVGKFLRAAMNRPVEFRRSQKPGAERIDYGTRPDDLAPLWHFLSLEGMRRGEALGLRWSDVNWDRGTVHISQTVISDKSNRGVAKVQSRTKTKTGSRTVRMTAMTLEALKVHKKTQNERRLASADWEDNDLIVCTSMGKPISPANVTRSFERLIKQAGLPRIRVHDLRHTCATILLRSGVQMKIVSERLGHASVGITSDLYSHVSPDMQESAADAMNDSVTKFISA